MKHWDVLNMLVERHGFQSYLEIGVQDPSACFNKILCSHKVSVDPFPRGECTFVGTSDEFFVQNKDTFDLVFIDGLHLREQVVRDILNSLKVLNPGGLILCHDTMPTTERMQQREDPGGEWTGDVWKALVGLRMAGYPVIIRTLDTDYGCTLVRPGPAEPLDVVSMEWQDFLIHKNEWLNVVPSL